MKPSDASVKRAMIFLNHRVEEPDDVKQLAYVLDAVRDEALEEACQVVAEGSVSTHQEIYDRIRSLKAKP